jgi:purine-binding chemotaxis protein CheW
MITTDATIESCVSFKIGQEIFAVSVRYIQEILEVGKITAIPHAPVFMKGVMNLRGAVLPVVDSRIKFGLPVTEVTEETSILVLDLTVGEKTLRIGAMVDAVNEVFEVNTGDIIPLPSIGARYNSDFIRGTVKAGDDFILFLDVVKVFTTDELVGVEGVVTEVKAG